MMLRCMFVCLLLLALFCGAPSPASAATVRTIVRPIAVSIQSRSAQRAAIRRMPLLMRPDRPGHFYGNSVRRIHRRRMR